jgi:importin subunit alpha-1
MPALAYLLTNQDDEVLADACWALSYLSDGDETQIQAVIDAGVVPAVVRLLGSPATLVVTPALRTMGNIVSGSEVQTQVAIDAGVLAALVPLISAESRTIRKEACWAVSNIGAGSAAQIDALVATPGMLPAVLAQASAAANMLVRKEAAWVIANVCSSGSAGNVVALGAAGSLRVLSELLDVNDTRMLINTLEALATTLAAAPDRSFAAAFDETGGVEKLENLQHHENEQVYKHSNKIIIDFFQEDEEAMDADENLVPTLVASDAAACGAPAAPAHYAFGAGAGAFDFSRPFTFTS